jgi:hypothetical protein
MAARNGVVRSTTLIALGVLAVTVPVQAQRGCGISPDPARRIEGNGQAPPGWMVRFDPIPANCTPLKLADVSFATMGTGLHVTSGPAALYYNPADTASGTYSVSASFANRTTAGHEALGLFIGGRNLQDSTQQYLYFVVKPASGDILIARRNGLAKPIPVDSNRFDPAVAREPSGGGAATNTVEIRVARDSVHFLANDRLVRSVAKSQLGGLSTDGQAGLRVNHNLNVHIEGFRVKRP